VHEYLGLALASLYYTWMLQLIQSWIRLLRSWIQYCDLQAGRDKLYRAAQYFSKYIPWYLQQTGASKDQIYLFQNLSKLLSNSRKLFRLGKWTESLIELYDLLANVAKEGDTLWATINILLQISNGAYYYYDMLQFLHFAKLFYSSNKLALDDKRNRAWLFRIIFGLLALYFKIDENSEKIKNLETSSSSSKDNSASFDSLSFSSNSTSDKSSQSLRPHGENEECENDETSKKRLQLLAKQRAYGRELTRNLVDIPVVLAALNYVNIHDGYVGILGTFTSLLGAYEKWSSSS